MKKYVVLPLLALAGGVGGFLARRWQLASAYVPETGLFTHGAPATLVLMGLLGLAAAAILLLLLPIKEGPEDFLPAFHSPETGQATVLTSAGLLLMIAGALGLWSGLDGLTLWQMDPDQYQMSTLAAQVAAALLCLPAGNGILLMGRMAYRNELNDWACRLAPLPALAGLVWLFSAHLKNGIEPVLMKYGIQLAAALLLTLAHYDIAAFLFGRPHRRRTVFLSLMGGVLGLTSLADGASLFYAGPNPAFALFHIAATLAYSLSALAFARALLRNAAGPSWPKRLEERMPAVEEKEQSE